MKNALKNSRTVAKSVAQTAPLEISDTKKTAQNLLKQIEEETKTQTNLGSRSKIYRQNRQATVVGLYGDLGSGKTTFMQFFGEALGVKEKILSPTFVIEKIYKIAHPDFDHLIHIDAYRLENAGEMRNLGWENIVKNPRNLIAVEWADRIAGLLPDDHIRVNFFHHDERSRLISFD